MALILIVDECWGETKAETIVKVQLNDELGQIIGETRCNKKSKLRINYVEKINLTTTNHLATLCAITIIKFFV